MCYTNMEMAKLKGTIRKNDLEGGFWELVADDGEHYQLKGGGQLHITYTGPAGASLELIERGPCGEGDDCIPSGTEEGERSFGDLPATLVALGDGGLMIAAENVTDGRWWITGRGIDEVALTQIASDLVLVGR